MRYQEGQTVEGTVENGADFGVFVELEPGLSGLIPISELGLDKNADPRSAFSPGDKLKLKLMALDPNRRRISLSLRALERDRERQEYLQHMESGGGAEPEMTGFGAQLAAALSKEEKLKAQPSKDASSKKAAKEKTAAKKTTAKKSTAKKTTAKKTTAKKAKTTTKKKASSKKTAEKK